MSTSPAGLRSGGRAAASGSSSAPPAPMICAGSGRSCQGPRFLIPGVGAQGGELEAAVACCHGTDAPGVVNVSRGIAGASSGDDWQEAAGMAAASLRTSMQELGATLDR